MLRWVVRPAASPARQGLGSVGSRGRPTFAAFNEIYTEIFGTEAAPARSCVEAARLPKDALVEIEAIAFINQ